MIIKPNEFPSRILVNEETGQVIYRASGVSYSDLEKLDNGSLISSPLASKSKEKHTSTIIFLHGTYRAINNFREIEKNFPNTKFIYPYSPVLQYDMWHGSKRAPGGQERG